MNTFAQLDDKKKGYQGKIEEIDKEIKEIKEAVIKYAGSIGNIQGADTYFLG